MATASSCIDWPSASAFSGPQGSPGFRFWRDFMVWQRGMNEVLRPLNLTQPQFALLATIAWLTRGCGEASDLAALSQQALADHLGLERMHVSQVVSKLEAVGLVSRAQPMQDRRTKGLAVTQAGAQRLAAALPVVEAYDRAFFAAAARGAPE